MNLFRFFLLLCWPLITLVQAAEEIRIWPGNAPGDTPEETGLQEHPVESTDGKPTILRIAEVAFPTVQHFAPKGKNTGACVLICPGGGYNVLAYEHEGTAVAEWFTSIGIHAVVLKYRVPRRVDREVHEAPLQDAQRAMGLIRSKAQSWGIDPKRIGVLGFSAGGNLAAWLAASHAERSYLVVDGADDESCRPAFAFLIYPSFMAGDKMISSSNPLPLLNKKSPPIFIAVANDDPHAGSGAAAYARLLEVGSRVEIHAYAQGGHGFGLKPEATSLVASTWTRRAADWFGEMGFREPLPEPVVEDVAGDDEQPAPE